MGQLPQPRGHSAAVSMENIGTYLIGGPTSDMYRTTDFLPEGTTEWVAGPEIPVDMNYPCALSISQLSFLIIYGNDIREYDVDISNPLSSSGWQPATKFPQLQTRRELQPGCGKIGDQVVIGGGYDASGYLSSTEVLNLSTRTISYAGDLNSPRGFFHMASITKNGEQMLLAFGGVDETSTAINSVEHFDNNTWTLAPTTMQEARFYFGAMVTQREIVCPTF